MAHCRSKMLPMDQISIIDTPEAILELLETRGGESYFGEPVTVLEHCLQSAHFATIEGKSEELITAALLHDVGHLLHQETEDIAEQGHDTRHEELGQTMLAAHLPPSVTEPIRMHVAAKRYLCHVDPAYFEDLSPSSKLSLKLQGGPMSREEAESFLAQPFAQDAIQLRQYDDRAKIPGLDVSGASAYLSFLKSLWR
jgi:[1-hydroxy-2-(trimethylamino)ethyl]phosphonate dioxygenase